jgi:hypothetical protein
MLQGALRLLHGGGSKDALQPLAHLSHPIGGGYGQRVQKCGCRSHILVGPSKVGKLSLRMHQHHSPASLQRQFALELAS